jgi:Bacterial extracellular solute-binding proteins, family 3
VLSAAMSTYMRSTITTPPAPPLVHTNPEEGIGMRYHGPGCGGRYMTSSIGISPGPAAPACDRERLVTVPIPDNQREYDIQHGLVDIVAHTMTITCGRLKREDFSSVCFDAHQRVLLLKNSKAHSLADLRGQKVCSTIGATSITRLSSELDLIERELASATSNSRDTERTVAALLGRRDELRGLFDAYMAKAARLGATEDPRLAARYDQARELLWTAPCDLNAAADAVNRFQQAVLTVGAQRL